MMGKRVADWIGYVILSFRGLLFRGVLLIFSFEFRAGLVLVFWFGEVVFSLVFVAMGVVYMRVCL